MERLNSRRKINYLITISLVCLLACVSCIVIAVNTKSANYLSDINSQVDNSDVMATALDNTWDFSYKGAYETFTVPRDGFYYFEAWGAEGGYADNNATGKGGYVAGKISLKQGDVFYIYVGQSGWNAGGNAVGFNAGQGTGGGTPGGGATDFRLVSGVWDTLPSLCSRIMIAGGGGSYLINGHSYNAGTGPGHAGGLTGLSGGNRSNSNIVSTPAGGGTQISAGAGLGYGAGKFGYGGNGAGGGGGYYGGGGSDGNAGGGGGSSFISGHTGCNAIASSITTGTPTHTGQPNHYSGKVFSETVMVAGNASMKDPAGGANTMGRKGHGYARITEMNKIPEAASNAIRTKTTTRVDADISYIVKNGNPLSVAQDPDIEDGIYYQLSSEAAGSVKLLRIKGKDTGVWNTPLTGSTGEIKVGEEVYFDYEFVNDSAVGVGINKLILKPRALFVPTVPEEVGAIYINI